MTGSNRTRIGSKPSTNAKGELMNAPTRPVVAAFLAVLVLSACSSSAKTGTPRSAETTTAASTTTTSHIDYGHQYLQIVAPGNVAIGTFETRANALPSSATIDDLSKLTTTLADSMEVTSQKLMRAAWPTTARRDIRDLLVAVSVVIADLHDVSNQTVLTIRTWKDHLSADLGRAAGHVAIVRADLGLPPAKRNTGSAGQGVVA